MTQLKVGDEVFISWNQIFTNGLYKVTKISRNVAYIDKKGYSFDISSFYVHAKSSATTGRAFKSEEAFLKHKSISTAWDSFRSKVNDTYNYPKNITLEEIATMMATLEKSPF